MLLLLAACVYEPPLDPDAPTVDNVLAGDVVVTGADAVAPTFVLLFDAADPPPPVGTGSPIDFTGVRAEDYTGVASSGQGGGIQAAPWSITAVPSGSWLVTALMDTDGDFQPLLSVTAGATCGDWLGAHLADIATGEVGVVTVADGTLLDDITVVVGTQLTTERPAFTMPPTTVTQTSAELQLLSLGSIGVHAALTAEQTLDLDGPFDGSDPCGTMFLFYAPDADADGAPDPHPNPALAAQGLYDIWPKVYLQYYGADVTQPGVGLEPGESWAAEAVVYPAPLLTGDATLGAPTPRTSLDVVWIPGAVHTLPDGTEETVYAPDLPPGLWSITVVQYTGQTWTIPNELPAFPSTDAAFDPLSQAVGLTVE